MTAAGGRAIQAAALALVLAAGAGAAWGAPATPKLVLVVVVDQLRADRVTPDLPGGLGRLAREGRRFADALLEHAPTDTCAGHAVILSGRHPGAAGVPGNLYWDPERGEVRYCVEDPSPDAAGLHGGPGRSPGTLRATTLGDWLKQAHAGARVFAVSGKDRSAVMLGGKQPDGVYWLDGGDPPRFTTSRAYQARPPAWLRRFDGEVEGSQPLLDRVPERWSYRLAALSPTVRLDDTPFEDGSFGRTSGHPLRARSEKDDLGLLATPYADALTLDLARLLIHTERLGTDPTPDLFALSLSATDWIGHRYGPESQEAYHALRALDRALGEFVQWLETVTGKGGLLVVLTSDHGVVPIPEWLDATGRSECPVKGGRVDARALLAKVEQHLGQRFGADPEVPERWLRVLGPRLAVDPAVAQEHDVEVSEVVAEVERLLEAEPAIAHAWTRDEIEEGRGPEPFARLYRNGFDPERSGDLVVQVARDCLVSLYEDGTDHGSPYRYDRAVPLVFWGPGIDAGVIRGPASPVDVAPTLAAWLGLPAPEGLDGHVLPLALAPAP